MPIALLALAAFITVIIVWNVVFKRNMGEAMLLGLVVTVLFAGAQAPAFLLEGLTGALTHDVLYAALAFVFMAYLIDVTGLIQKILAILNSVFGRIRGGPAFVDTAGSAVFGALSGSNSANTASSGSFTGPWMVRTGWSPTRAATVLAGNGGMGAALPPSASMVIMVGFAGGLVTTGQVYLGLLAAGAYQILLRMVLVLYFVRRDGIPKAEERDLVPLRTSLKQGAGALSIFLGALIPIVVTVGPLADYLTESTPLGDTIGEISLLTWIPVLIIAFSLVAGRDRLPSTFRGWWTLLDGALPKFANIGALLFFAIAASEVLGRLGLAEDVNEILQTLPINGVLMVVVVGLVITLVAGPLSSTATLTAVGQISFLTLVGVGVDPLTAVIAILVFASTEGASPPASGSIFVAAGLTGARPESTFIPLIVYYMIPILLIGCLIGWGVLPIPGS
ncbi:TRAP transporter large permease subunit [Marinitenerispora sediminis]|uniref:C4-dicarboxylate ABC transporter permease n=1 Tax=Marinitenerispora sediminis TaxID=1931232 RepID=A0A368T3J8_9ACTN|nr:TRAP transporter large permease subunit [Marinitenerispora sediminis]RCV49364.1 C4-dicarboxylate ABC transporter permease [Marinitenerispora sediminis]RCV55983.1 C4-dicarboxylate ABC transporter permease [Marinitenerispora sediminis]RCV56598.1 C4-dicarboxylate ABC transporter permease [Marinitenerispora sediminis]